MQSKKLSRRSAIQTFLTGTVSVAAGGLLSSSRSADKDRRLILKGNINHSVCRWCFSDWSTEELCREAKKIGIRGIDLVGPKDWPVLKKYGLTSSMCNGAELSLTKGWNDPSYHAALVKRYKQMIELVAKAGYKNLICFSGNRNGLDDQAGIKNCLTGLKQILSFAEQHKVILHMELLNSKIDHQDYQCDSTSWGVELSEKLSSENFKILYDIYHMQINEGDLIRTIQTNHQYIGHYHTAGVPGRNEIDDAQEINYPAVMKAIYATGFKGFVAQEFIPKNRNRKESLRKAIELCDI